jgi:hypothetical protein
MKNLFRTLSTWEKSTDVYSCENNLKKFQKSKENQIQSDQKENKSKQALQILSHVVAEFYANKRLLHGRRQFVISNGTL